MDTRHIEIYSLLIPLAEGRLLIPRSCVAEVIGFQAPTQMIGAPPWYLGMVVWNARQVPLVSFEGVCGQQIPALGGRSRIVLFHCQGPRIDAGVFGIVSQGFPQLVRVNAEVVRPDPDYVQPERFPVLCRARMVNDTPLIPDLERLEGMIAEETTVGLS
jgi:chemosensory pili system protein ChpC